MSAKNEQSILVAIYEKLLTWRTVPLFDQKFLSLVNVSRMYRRVSIGLDSWIRCNIYRMSRLRCHSNNAHTHIETNKHKSERLHFISNEVSVYQNMYTICCVTLILEMDMHAILLSVDGMQDVCGRNLAARHITHTEKNTRGAWCNKSFTIRFEIWFIKYLWMYSYKKRRSVCIVATSTRTQHTLSVNCSILDYCDQFLLRQREFNQDVAPSRFVWVRKLQTNGHGIWCKSFFFQFSNGALLFRLSAARWIAKPNMMVYVHDP